MEAADGVCLCLVVLASLTGWKNDLSRKQGAFAREDTTNRGGRGIDARGKALALQEENLSTSHEDWQGLRI